MSYSIENFDVDPKKFLYWIGVAAVLVGFTILFTFSLMYLNPLGKPQAMISEEEANEQSNQGGTKRKADSKTISTGANNTREMESSQSNATRVTEDRLQLLGIVTGAFRPGVLTAMKRGGQVSTQDLWARIPLKLSNTLRF
ncbi:hypothetical protein LWI29_020922 [Acer saccharum]|uniref:Plant PDR ABC transporter associated domain-containing protein n=1 Tax=Acer saccharum TaxID=4024 RepID=A0AA39STH9_ACESA|nr:hypothetical protein LWI29_020922 [Acer saccharum]